MPFPTPSTIFGSGIRKAYGTKSISQYCRHVVGKFLLDELLILGLGVVFRNFLPIDNWRTHIYTRIFLSVASLILINYGAIISFDLFVGRFALIPWHYSYINTGLQCPFLVFAFWRPRRIPVAPPTQRSESGFFFNANNIKLLYFDFVEKIMAPQ